jgi:hypothetical protein
MKQDIENIIKKNLPEKKEHDWSKDEHTKTCKDGCTYCCNADGMINGFNQALSKINTELITQKILEVIKKEIHDCMCEHNETRHGDKPDDAYDRVLDLFTNYE